MSEIVPTPAPVVLLADDEPSIRRVMSQLLPLQGFDVLLAADGEEAVKAFALDPARVTAVVLDLGMPRVNGREALKRIRALSKTVPVVVTSGAPGDELPGVAMTLLKPYAADDLIAALRKVSAPG